MALEFVVKREVCPWAYTPLSAKHVLRCHSSDNSAFSNLMRLGNVCFEDGSCVCVSTGGDNQEHRKGHCHNRISTLWAQRLSVYDKAFQATTDGNLGCNDTELTKSLDVSVAHLRALNVEGIWHLSSLLALVPLFRHLCYSQENLELLSWRGGG